MCRDNIKSDHKKFYGLHLAGGYRWQGAGKFWWMLSDQDCDWMARFLILWCPCLNTVITLTIILQCIRLFTANYWHLKSFVEFEYQIWVPNYMWVTDNFMDAIRRWSGKASIVFPYIFFIWRSLLKNLYSLGWKFWRWKFYSVIMDMNQVLQVLLLA